MKIVKIDFLIEREGAYLGDDRLIVSVPGDWSAYKCSFGVKFDKKTPTSNLLIVKKNTLAGGSNDELELVYDGTNTIFKISLLEADKQDFIETKYYCDIRVEDASSFTKAKIIASGILKLEFNPQNKLSGTNLPSNGIRYIPLPETIADGKVPRKKNSDPTLWESIDVYTKAEVDDVLTAVREGIIVQKTAGVALGGHRAVVLDATAKVIYADQSNLDHANKVLGITTGAAALNALAIIKTYGELTEPTWNWTLNQPVFLGANGLLTQTVPTSGFILIVGFPIEATKLFIEIKQPIIIQ